MYDEKEVDINDELDAINPDDKLPSTSDNGKLKFEDPEKHTGVVYLASIPPLFTVRKVREAFSNFGEIGRIYLQVIHVLFGECFITLIFLDREAKTDGQKATQFCGRMG